MDSNIDKNNKHIFYFDALRALAILCVITIHVFMITKNNLFFSRYSIHSIHFILLQLMGNPFGVGVDIFLMLSGALLLGRKWDIKDFLSKRIPRITYPFFFWNVLFIALIIILFSNSDITIIKNFHSTNLISFLINTVQGKEIEFCHNWYFWMIFGVYLILPIFNKWILNSNLKEVEYFLSIWLITCLFDFTLEMNFPVNLSYFTSPIGFVILGYYLRHTKRKVLNNPYITLIILIITSIIMVYLSIILTTPDKLYNFNKYSIFTTIIGASLFLLFKNYHKFQIKFELKKIRKFTSSLAKYSYGIYIIHNPLIYMIFYILPVDSIGYYPTILLIYLSAIFIPLGILMFLNKIPFLNRLIGSG